MRYLGDCGKAGGLPEMGEEYSSSFTFYIFVQDIHIAILDIQILIHDVLFDIQLLNYESANYLIKTPPIYLNNNIGGT